MEREVLPWVRQRFNLSEHRITYRTLKVVGVGESTLDGIIGDLVKPGGNPEIGLLASLGEIKIRIAVRSRDEAEARSLIAPVEAEIRTRLGKKVFGQDNETLEGVIHWLLEKEDQTLSILETFSGGMAAHRFYQMPSTRLIESAVVTDQTRLARFADNEALAWDKSAAETLANTMRRRTGADVGLAILGFPVEKELGLELSGHAVAAGKTFAKHFSWKMGGDVGTLQRRGSVIGLNTLRLALLEFHGSP
jgi:nicotinamide-nucleotide amidase